MADKSMDVTNNHSPLFSTSSNEDENKVREHEVDQCGSRKTSKVNRIRDRKNLVHQPSEDSSGDGGHQDVITQADVCCIPVESQEALPRETDSLLQTDPESTKFSSLSSDLNNLTEENSNISQVDPKNIETSRGNPIFPKNSKDLTKNSNFPDLTKGFTDFQDGNEASIDLKETPDLVYVNPSFRDESLKMSFINPKLDALMKERARIPDLAQIPNSYNPKVLSSLDNTDIYFIDPELVDENSSSTAAALQGKPSLKLDLAPELALHNSISTDTDLNPKETDSLLKPTKPNGALVTRKGITKSTSADIDRPVLRVQFDRRFSENAGPMKEPCSSPTRSLSSSSSSSSSSEDNSSIGISEARPPDGGWGWVVVFASFMVNLIADGITFSFGVMYVEFLSYFGEGKSKTAWIGSLFMAMPLLSGPVASFLTDRYGCRKVSIVGSILASTGFVISSFANSMEVLFFTFGILSGFGLSLCYVAAVVIVAYYFDKRRSFATGLSVCGSGIGTFIFAPLTQVLLAEYGWRGTTLILAGLFLNLAVCGALMRDLPWTSHKRKLNERKRGRERKRRKHGSSADTFSVSNSTNTASAVQTTSETAFKDDIEHISDDRLFSSLVNLPTYVRNGEKVPVEVLELLSTHKNVYNMLMHNYPGLLTSSRSFSDSGRLHENNPTKFIPTISPLAVEPSNQPHPTSNTDAAFLWWLKKTGSADSAMPPRLQQRKLPAYLRDLRVHRLSLTYRGAMLNINRYRLKASSCPDIYRNSMTTIAKEKSQWYSGMLELRDLMAEMLDFSYFAEPRFLLFSLSNFLLYTWYDVPYVYLTDYAIEMGYSEADASMLIAIVGIVNMIGEIVLGWAGDRSWVNASLVYAVCMGFCGAVTGMIPLLTSYAGLCVVSGAFGLFIAANYSLTSIILVELITLEKFTNAYGLLLLVQGVANLIGPPLAGWLYDITDKYDLSFYLAGFFIAMSGLLLIVLPLTNRYRYFQSLQRQASGVSDASLGATDECSPKEPSIHRILASCITGSTEKCTEKINHV